MKMRIRPLVIPEIKSNEVTSHKVFKDRQAVDSKGRYVFHEDGIFSRKIFGQFNQCNCIRKPVKSGTCSRCNTRVLDKGNLPTFYIKFDNLRFLNYGVDVPEKCKKLLDYNAFLYKGKVLDLDLKTLDLTVFDLNEIKIGKEAMLELGYSEDWYYENTSNKLVIPHTSMRPILQSSTGEHVLGKLNMLYVELLKKRNRLDKFVQLEEKDYILEIAIKNKLLSYIQTIRDELVLILTNGKNSVVAKELRGQRIIGNIRAVMINNYDVDEDEIIIGKYFIPHLYPKFSKEFELKTGGYNVKALNQKLRDEQYRVLINRQPTISAKSILGAIPQFSERDLDQFVVQVNPIILEALSGDVDGDVLSVIALYSKEANQEADKLLTSKNYIEGSDGSIRQGLPEDFIYAKLRKENQS